jgi:hypothetical protein
MEEISFGGSSPPKGGGWRKKRQSKALKIFPNTGGLAKNVEPNFKLKKFKTIQDLRPVWNDTRVQHILGRFFFDLDEVLDIHMIQFLADVDMFKKFPGGEDAGWIFRDYLAVSDEAETGELCRRGLYRFATDEAFLEAVKTVQESRKGKVEKSLFVPIVEQVTTYLNRRYFEVKKYTTYHFPTCIYAASLFEIIETGSRKSKRLAKSREAKAFFQELEEKLRPKTSLMLSPRGRERAPDKTAEAVRKLGNRLVFSGGKAAKDYLEKKADQIARLAMAYSAETVRLITQLDDALVQLDNQRQEKQATSEEVRSLEGKLYAARFRLTTGVCNDREKSDFSEMALPFPSKSLIEIARQEVELRVDAAELTNLSFSREVTEEEGELLKNIKEADRWRHIAPNDKVILPREFRVNRKPLPTESTKAFEIALAEALQEPEWDSARCKRLVAATSISAFSLFATELRTILCPEIFSIKDIDSKKDGTATDYDIFTYEDGSARVVTTAWYDAQWFGSGTVETPQIARFCLGFEFGLGPKLELQTLTICLRQLTLSDLMIPDEKRKVVLKALRQIGAAGKIYSTVRQGRRSVNFTKPDWVLVGKGRGKKKAEL